MSSVQAAMVPNDITSANAQAEHYTKAVLAAWEHASKAEQTCARSGPSMPICTRPAWEGAEPTVKRAVGLLRGERCRSGWQP